VIDRGKTRIVVAEDNADLRTLLQLVIDAENDLGCVGATGSLSDVAALASREAADVVVLDLELNGESSLHHLSTLRDACPAARFVIYSGHAHPKMKEGAMLAGASDYVLKSGDSGELLQAIRAAMQRERPVAS